MAELFRTPQKGQPRPSRSRRTAITQKEIEKLKQKIAVTSNATRPFVFGQPGAPGEETQRKIRLAATTEFGRQQFITQLALKEYCDVNFAEWYNKMEQARTYCRIYSTDLTPKEMDNICLVVYKYICFMSTLLDYRDYQLKQSEIITKRLDPPLYNITKCIPWLVQKWPEIQ